MLYILIQLKQEINNLSEVTKYQMSLLKGRDKKNSINKKFRPLRNSRGPLPGLRKADLQPSSFVRSIASAIDFSEITIGAISV